METKQNLFWVQEQSQLVTAVQSDELLSLTLQDLNSLPSNCPVITSLSALTLVSSTVVVVDSIKSGSGRNVKTSVYHQLIKPVLSDVLKVSHKYLATESAASISEIALQLQLEKETNKPLTLVVIGGDTSVNELVNGLVRTPENLSLNLMVVPSGTGNSLALSVGIDNIFTAVSKLVTHKKEDARPLNLYEALFPKGSYFINQGKKVGEIEKPLKFLVVTSWAFHAALVADSDTPELREYGIERFKMAAMENLSRVQKYDGEVILRNKSLKGPFAYLVLVASRRFEPTFEILPQGDIFENSLYLVSFDTDESDASGKYIIEVMDEIYNGGKHVENEKVTYEKITDEVKLQIQDGDIRNRRFCLDGSIIMVPEGPQTIDIKPVGNIQNSWSIYIIS